MRYLLLILFFPEFVSVSLGEESGSFPASYQKVIGVS